MLHLKYQWDHGFKSTDAMQWGRLLHCLLFEPAEVEAEYTLFLYEQMRAILDAMDRHHYDSGQRTAVFWSNAERILVTGLSSEDNVVGGEK